jgi:Ribbon-helix-helix domain
MKSSVVKRFKRSIVIDGHKTSVSLEDAFWTDLKTIAHAQQVTLSELVLGSTIRANRTIYPRRSACLFLTTSVMKTGEWRWRRLIFP